MMYGGGRAHRRNRRDHPCVHHATVPSHEVAWSAQDWILDNQIDHMRSLGVRASAYATNRHTPVAATCEAGTHPCMKAVLIPGPQSHRRKSSHRVHSHWKAYPDRRAEENAADRDYARRGWVRAQS